MSSPGNTDAMDTLTYKYLVAENSIHNSIRNFEADTKINGERKFAKELGISYMTVRKAVENLVHKGILYKIPRKGTFVASREDMARN
jgi:DNA-binding GntR family transcriptional regulator